MCAGARGQQLFLVFSFPFCIFHNNNRMNLELWSWSYIFHCYTCCPPMMLCAFHGSFQQQQQISLRHFKNHHAAWYCLDIFQSVFNRESGHLKVVFECASWQCSPFLTPARSADPAPKKVKSKEKKPWKHVYVLPNPHYLWIWPMWWHWSKAPYRRIIYI